VLLSLPQAIAPLHRGVIATYQQQETQDTGHMTLYPETTLLEQAVEVLLTALTSRTGGHKDCWQYRQ
jgi:hypothetical protein